MIVTPYGHVLYTKMLQIARRFVSAILRNEGRGGEGYFSAHAHVIMCDPLPVVQAACRVKYSTYDYPTQPSSGSDSELLTVRSITSILIVARKGDSSYRSVK